MSVPPRLANRIWAFHAGAEAMRYRRACGRVAETQEHLLLSTLKRNADTAYGVRHGFPRITSVAQYQEQVPLVSYDDIAPYIDAMAEGAEHVLTRDTPLCFECTSGSTRPTKLIPYTMGLQRQFQAGISPWIADMMRRHPQCTKGTSYWSLSPLLRQHTRTAGGTPIGLPDDTAYLHARIRRIVRRTMAVPLSISQVADLDTARYVTLAFLLKAHDLAFISVWNPTFLSLLLAPLGNQLPELLRDLANGSLSRTTGMTAQHHKELGKMLGKNRHRATAIEKAAGEEDGAAAMYERIWPNLTLISCWAHAASRGPAQDLRRVLPHAQIVPKGLLATEGIVSFPYGHEERSTLALRSHFFEFIPGESGGRPVTAWELERGEHYEVVLTTGGGLYRYRLGDLITVTGHLDGCPQIEFLGRCDAVSDVFGEKISAGHVARILEKLFGGWSVKPPFTLLAPDGDPDPDRYVLFMADEKHPGDDVLGVVSRLLEEGLSENAHYAYCRHLGQLQEAKICWLEDSAAAAHALYHAACIRRGQRAGDVKPPLLTRETGWRSVLHAHQRASAKAPGQPVT